MLSNAYFLAKFRFDTAENEPAKNLQNFAKKMLMLIPAPAAAGASAASESVVRPQPLRPPRCFQVQNSQHLEGRSQLRPHLKRGAISIPVKTETPPSVAVFNCSAANNATPQARSQRASNSLKIATAEELPHQRRTKNGDASRVCKSTGETPCPEPLL